MALQKTPFKVDKNGTEYYADYTCQRCGGLGGADQWAYTGWTCYDCGGSGQAYKPLVYKKYTPEYQAKLDARREKRNAEKLAKRIAEFNEHFNEKLMDMGFSADGKIYVVKGDTYPIRAELKEAGARYRSNLNWFFDNANSGYDTVEIDYTDCLDIFPEYGTIEWNNCEKAIEKIKAVSVEESHSKHIGEIGQRITVEVTYKNQASYEKRAYCGWHGMETVYVQTFEDADGNVYVWKSSSAYMLDNELGDKVNLTGTVKEHDNYKGVNQTILQRCKIK